MNSACSKTVIFLVRIRDNINFSLTTFEQWNPDVDIQNNFKNLLLYREHKILNLLSFLTFCFSGLLYYQEKKRFSALQPYSESNTFPIFW